MTEAEKEKAKAKTVIWFMSEVLVQEFISKLHRHSIDVGAYAQNTLVIMKRNLTPKEIKKVLNAG